MEFSGGFDEPERPKLGERPVEFLMRRDRMIDSIAAETSISEAGAFPDVIATAYRIHETILGSASMGA
jgi:hypothetical protein